MKTITNLRENITSATHDKTVLNRVKTVFEAMAHEQVIREQIEPIQKMMIEKIGAKDKRTGKPIKRLFDTYKMSDEQFNEWLEECQHDYNALGYTEKKYHGKDAVCPLLEAESLTRGAKKALVYALEAYTGISFNDLMFKFKLYDNYIETNLKFFVKYI